MRADDGGQFWNVIIGAGVGAGFSIASQMLSGKSFSSIDWKQVGISAVAGGLAAIPAVGALGGSLIGATGNVINGVIGGDVKSVKDGAVTFAISVASGYVGTGDTKLAGRESIKQLSKLSKNTIKQAVRNTRLISNSKVNFYKSYGNLKKVKGLGDSLLGKNRAAFIGGSYGELANIGGGYLKSKYYR